MQVNGSKIMSQTIMHGFRQHLNHQVHRHRTCISYNCHLNNSSNSHIHIQAVGELRKVVIPMLTTGEIYH